MPTCSAGVLVLNDIVLRPLVAPHQGCLNEADRSLPSKGVVLQGVAEYFDQPCHLKIGQIQFGANALALQVIISEEIRLLLYLVIKVPPVEMLRESEPLITAAHDLLSL